MAPCSFLNGVSELVYALPDPRPYVSILHVDEAGPGGRVGGLGGRAGREGGRGGWAEWEGAALDHGPVTFLSASVCVCVLDWSVV